MCLQCHGPSSPNGPHAPTIEAHTQHEAGSAGNECVNCHMPKIETQLADVNVRAHTFKFIPPSSTTQDKVPNACNTCHTDKTPAVGQRSAPQVARPLALACGIVE